MEEGERERLERILEAVTLAENADEVRAEIRELLVLADQARMVQDADVEAKLSRLKGLLKSEGFFARPDQRLLLFTEFKDTLDYLVDKLKAWGFRVGFIHGGMKPGSRLYAEQQFKDGAIQVLVATEAAGEGINLQCCHILFNYDIPWNPNRLEQRMGRIHRYGQVQDCLIFNFVATNTIEGRVLRRLLHDIVLWPGWSTPKLGLGLYEAAPFAAFIIEFLYGIFCWYIYRGGLGLLALICFGNLANLSFLSPAVPGPEEYMAGRPMLLVTVIFVQIVVTLVLVGVLARRKAGSAATWRAEGVGSQRGSPARIG